MEPEQFASFCRGLKDIWKMLEHPVDKNDLSSYREMKAVFEKSLVTGGDFPAGHTLGRGDLAAKKPGRGIPVGEYSKVVGRKLARAVSADHMLDWSDFVS